MKDKGFKYINKINSYTIDELENILNNMDSNDPSKEKFIEYIKIEKEFLQRLEDFKNNQNR